MTPALDATRTAFIAAVRQETPGTDLARYVAVLDALLAWTTARGDRLTFSAAPRRPGVIRFERAKSKETFWSVQPVRAAAPMLEIHLASSRPSSAADKAEAMRTLNAHSRAVLAEGDRLRIGFGALKNAAALAAVLELLDRLLADAPVPAGGPPAVAPANESA